MATKSARLRLAILVAAVAWLCAPALPALATTIEWIEAGEAGQKIDSAQPTVGTGTLLSISGEVGDPDPADAADLFAFRIGTGPVDVTVALELMTAGDVGLFLLDHSGAAIKASVSDLFPGFWSGEASVSAQLEAGLYYLAVAASGFEPHGADGSPLFDASGLPVGGGGVLTSWGFAGDLVDPQYVIAFTQGLVLPSAPAQVPAPSSLLLLGSGVIVALAGAYRRTRRSV